MIKKNNSMSSPDRRKMFFILMTAVITAGIAAGSCTAVSSDFLRNSPLANQYISPLFNGATLLEIIMNTFLSVSGILAVVFCTGFFAVGQPVAIMVLAYRGFGIGLSAAYTYMTFGKSGVYLTMLFIVPKIIATSVIIMLAVREAMKLSNIIYSYIFRDSPEDSMGRYIRLYCIKFIVLILFVFLTAIADSGINYFFGYLL